MFAGGIGEKSALLRKTLVDKSRALGFALDESANEQDPKADQPVMDISGGSGRDHRVLVCQTNEQVSVMCDESLYLCLTLTLTLPLPDSLAFPAMLIATLVRNGIQLHPYQER